MLSSTKNYPSQFDTKKLYTLACTYTHIHTHEYQLSAASRDMSLEYCS